VIRAWVADGGGARAVEAPEAIAAIKAGGTAWIDLEGEDEEAARRVLEPLGVHPLVIEGVAMQLNRPKVDDYGSSLYLVVHSARWDQDRPHLREVDIVLGERFLVTYHDGTTRSIAAAHEILPRRPQLLSKGPATLLHFILDVLVDLYLPIMDHLAEEVDTLEDQLFTSASRRLHLRVVGLKRGMSALRRIVGPQRDTVLALTRDEFRTVPPEIRPYLRDVYDRLARVSDLLESFRAETASLLELHVSMVSNRLNQVIKRLTVIATIGLPLTVVTGYYGMNFALPEYKWPWGEWYALGLLVLTGGATWWFLRRQRLD
jgi:magnesium transporter